MRLPGHKAYSPAHNYAALLYATPCRSGSAPQASKRAAELELERRQLLGRLEGAQQAAAAAALAAAGGEEGGCCGAPWRAPLSCSLLQTSAPTLQAEGKTCTDMPHCLCVGALPAGPSPGGSGALPSLSLPLGGGAAAGGVGLPEGLLERQLAVREEQLAAAHAAADAAARQAADAAARHRLEVATLQDQVGDVGQGNLLCACCLTRNAKPAEWANL